MRTPDTMLVRLKPYDSKRKFVLRRYAYRGIHFLVGEGWKRVPKAVAGYLRAVRQKEFDAYSPAAFDVCTDAEARAIDGQERRDATKTRTAVEAIHTTMPRSNRRATTAPVDTSPADEADDDDDAETPRRVRRTVRVARRARRGGRTS